MDDTKTPNSKLKLQTNAWLAFERNLESVIDMTSFAKNEVALLKAEVTRLTRLVKKPRDLTNKAESKKLKRSLEGHAKTLQARTRRIGTATLWQVVVLVTCVEAYLQDLLTSAASVDPELMSESQQSAPYADIITAGSLDELANELRARWASRWLSDGGPARWITRFEKMGVRGYPNDLASRLELVWGIRHAAVHGAGVATRDFVRRHPGKATKGAQLRVTVQEFADFAKAVTSLVEATEQSFLARYPSLAESHKKTQANEATHS